MQPKTDKRKLEALQWKTEKDNCLKYIYQLLTEISHGMYDENEEQSSLIKDSEALRDNMEYYFAHEITEEEDHSAAKTWTVL